MIEEGSSISWSAGERSQPDDDYYGDGNGNARRITNCLIQDTRIKFFMDARIPSAVPRLVPVIGNGSPKDPIVVTPS